MMDAPIVSVIIPVYNAEKTLPFCLASLSKLTYPYLQFIFVDDCSTDGSLACIEAFAEGPQQGVHWDVKVIRQAVNRGVAAARNTGLDHATGTYIYYVDADDQIDPETIAEAVEKAQQLDADIVGFNWYLAFDKNKRKMNQPAFHTAWEAVEMMLRGTMRWNLWLFLVRRSLYEEHQIRFLPGMNMGEDMMVMTKLFAHAERVAYMDKAFYHYRQSNETSLTKTYSEQHMAQVAANIQELEGFLAASKYASRIGDLIGFLKLNNKLPFLISPKVSQYKRWLSWFPEANRLVLKNTSLPWRTRLLQYAAVKKQFWLLKGYYYFVIRFIYGIIYR
ncbi:glycosyltransferase family 2 protein [Sphingobacterium griseoflavum]|uniref:Glycosyl transferase family A n=1 Tax=Sphingobacterium griseoflavum TaxID=1474952 RepID=A0ABQ3HVX2_9SPHI|nr:glycosyltransferase family 2 protein [Sphingobacterium griseoflavum]GHE39786.1 glycosyl transferase family A [Sphingobacterium griseoflavum]